MKVALSKDAQKQLKKLPQSEQTKVVKNLTKLEENPLAGKKLEGEFKKIYSLRIWPYRILYEINTKVSRIEVHKILHRQSAYK